MPLLNNDPAPAEYADRPPAPLAGTRAEAMTRLKIGLAGLGAMLLIVGLSSVINDRVRETEASAVPEAAATTEPTQPPSSPKGDPLAEGGVVPDLPEPTATPTQPPAILPEQGAQLDDIDAR